LGITKWGVAVGAASSDGWFVTLVTQCLLVAQLRHAPLQWDLGFTLESGSLSDHDTRPGPASQPWHSMLGLTKVTPQSERRNLGL